jgi:hypothetical protein
MKVLIGCEYSGTVRDAFASLGHDAMSCDLLPTNKPGKHYQGDIFDVIDDGWDIGIFHPPCTYLSVSGMHWTTRGIRPQHLTDDALEFVRRLMACKIPSWALENPVSIISSKIRKPDQIIQPYDFGHDASKKTCLWLKGLPHLIPTLHVPGRLMNGKLRWANQTDSGQNTLTPSEDRWKIRSETYSGIAQAMAMQWSEHINKALKPESCEALSLSNSPLMQNALPFELVG